LEHPVVSFNLPTESFIEKIKHFRVFAVHLQKPVFVFSFKIQK
jgi:hypothetical protein